MLNDKDLIPLCQAWARRFMRQSRHLGAEDDVFNELTNEAYRVSKGLEKKIGVSTWIMWKLIEYTKIPDMTDRRGIGKKVDRPTDEICEMWEEHQKLIKAVSMLPEDEKLMIHFYYQDGMNYTTIGRKMGFSRTWIKKKIEHALRKLREKMI